MIVITLLENLTWVKVFFVKLLSLAIDWNKCCTKEMSSMLKCHTNLWSP